MRFGILGPFEVTDGDRVLDLGALRQRAVLAILAINANTTVSLDQLIDELWGDAAPAAATASIQAYISNLRRVLEPGSSVSFARNDCSVPGLQTTTTVVAVTSLPRSRRSSETS